MTAERYFRSQRVVLPTGVAPASVRVKGGRIDKIDAWAAVPEGAPLVDAGAAVIMPGVVDTHVHVNEPGRTEWEGFETATRAAAAGGVTTIVDMPLNSIPAATSAKSVAMKAALTEGRVSVDVGLWGGAIPENTSGDAHGLGQLLAEGARGFKCFLVPSGVDEFPYVSRENVEAALVQLRGTGVRLMVHAELPGPIDRVAQAMASEPRPPDPRRYASYLASRPPSAEDEAVALLYELCKQSGTPVHVVHLSSAGALPILRRARDEGVPLSAETAPHYLHFSAEQIPDGATWFKCAPPIREAGNRELLWDAVREGLISMIVSDHSPCLPSLKKVAAGDFMEAWGGIAGLQFGFSAVWTEASARSFELHEIARLMCERPAAHAGLAGVKGSIAAGHDADFAFLDPDAMFRVEPKAILHKHKLTPYDGELLRGVVGSTWLRGECVYDGGPPAAPITSPMGRWLKWER